MNTTHPFISLGNDILCLLSTFSNNATWLSLRLTCHHMNNTLVKDIERRKTAATQFKIHLVSNSNDSCKEKKKLLYFTKYIDEFYKNEKRFNTIFPTKNAYHRFLIHKYCSILGFKHENIVKGTKKEITCPICFSKKYLLNYGWRKGFYNHFTEWRFECKNCNYITSTSTMRHKNFKYPVPFIFISISK